MLRTILVPMADELPGELLLQAALSTAKHLEADIQAKLVQPDLATVLATTPGVMLAAGVTPEEIQKENARAAAASQAMFEQWRQRNKIPLPGRDCSERTHAGWSMHIGDLEEAITRFGRISDFLVVNRPTSTSMQSQRCFDAAVFGTGRPTLVISDPPSPDMVEHIIIAWNGSLEASRALAGAMPLLQQAQRITILTALEYDSDEVDLVDLADSLARHGLRTPEVAFPLRGHSAGAELLAAAQKQGATLIVMGAYTHSRLRQAFLGGVTRHLLAQSPIPLLMSH